MAARISIAQVKSRFSECVRKAEAGADFLITRHGKPVAALVPPADLAQLRRLRAAGPAAGLASLAGGWKESHELAAVLSRNRRTMPRRWRRTR
ncbi:MAG: type II toxin-antitoxin system Phd/YefM family antitoxin [Thermoanaerobaculia bacterium]